MVMVCHHLNPAMPEDVAFAESRGSARETIAAEDVLHDLGAISVIGSDSQGMGRIGETIARTWQVAAQMKVERGSLPEDAGTGQRQRPDQALRRQATRSTPRGSFGIDHEIGTLEAGKLADVVLWEPKFFGIKPEVVFKGGFLAWSVMGESNASLMTCEPLIYRPQWGAFGPARGRRCRVTFVIARAIDAASPARARPRASRSLPTRGTRTLTKARHAAQRRAVPRSGSSRRPSTCSSTASCATCEPADVLPLAQRYMLR